MLATGVLAAAAGGFAILTHRAHGELERKLERNPDSRVALEDAGLRIATFAAITGALGVGTLVAGGVAVHYGLSEGLPAPSARPPARRGLQLSFGAKPGALLATGRF